MKETKALIDKQLRLKGKVLARLVKYNDEHDFEKYNKVMNIFLKGEKSRKILCEEKYITTRNNNKIRVCIYSPFDKKPNATGLLWLHGGGYAMGIPELDMQYYEKLISVANCVIIAPDYTLSLEKPYPQALYDSYETLYWMKNNIEDLGIREDQIFVGGKSAGGGLAAGTVLYARDKKEVNVAFQMPLYPMLDDKMNTPSAINNDAPVWNSKSNYLAWKLYLGDLFETDNVSKYASPSRETDYSNLPPIFTFVGEAEPFYDETAQYIENLKKAGVKTHFYIHKGCYHSFDKVCSHSHQGRAAIKEMLETFKYATDNYFASQDHLK